MGRIMAMAKSGHRLRHRMLFGVVGMLCASALTGCASQAQRVQAQTQSDPVDKALLDAVKRIESSWVALGRLEQAKHPDLLERNAHQVEDAPPALRKPITLEWQGELEPLMRKLAREVGFDLVVIGKRPAVPVWVSVSAERQPIIDVIRNIGYQLGRRAGVVIHARRRKIDVVYPSA